MLRGEKLMATKRKFKRDYIMLEAKDMAYKYKDRVSPKAFAKIEITDEKSVIALYAENLKSISEGYSVVAIRSDYETIDLGDFNVNSQGKGEFNTDIENDIDIKGVAVIQDKAVPLIGFKGSKIENFEQILFPPQYELEELEESEGSDEIESIVDTLHDEYEYEEIEYIEVEGNNNDDINNEYEEIYEEPEEYEDIEYIQEDDGIDNEYEYEEVIYEEIEDYNEVGDDDIVVQPEIQPTPQERKSNKNKDEYIEKKINKAKSVLEKQHARNTYEDIKTNNQHVKTNNEHTKVAGTLLMPRQIKKGLKYFREVKPFVADYVDNTRWWKIEINPTTLCGYTMPYLGYVNSLNYTMYSDAVMQSYKYRHYLFGVQYDEYNKRKYYIYAVPGRKNEQPDKGHTGFTGYQACDNRNNSLGYWLCFVDCKARRIVK